VVVTATIPDGGGAWKGHHEVDSKDGGVTMAKDPICGMNVTESEAAASLIHNGRTFYFCAQSCYEAFKKAPDKYLVASKKEGWIGRFLNRLAKTSKDSYGNKPPTCH
jgi:YHS domain-containing protein